VLIAHSIRFKHSPFCSSGDETWNGNPDRVRKYVFYQLNEKFHLASDNGLLLTATSLKLNVRIHVYVFLLFYTLYKITEPKHRPRHVGCSGSFAPHFISAKNHRKNWNLVYRYLHALLKNYSSTYSKLADTKFHLFLYKFLQNKFWAKISESCAYFLKNISLKWINDSYIQWL
jgi:hypothetical protein